MVTWSCGASRNLSVVQRDSWDAAAVREHVFSLQQSNWKHAFLAYDTDAPDQHGSYKLPFADVVGGELKAVTSGLAAAAGRLDSADVSESCKASAREVLAHYKSHTQTLSDVDGEYSWTLGSQREVFTVERSAPVESQKRMVRISTEKPVRTGGGVIVADGMELGAYLANPVVMWMHDYRQPPIARSTSVTVTPGKGIDAEFEFPAPGVFALADVVRGLWDAGFINAASVGFQPLEWTWEKGPTPDGVDEYPVFKRSELYEFSLVSVPRDREALRRALGAEAGEGLFEDLITLHKGGLDLQQLYQGLVALRKVLNEQH